MKASRLYIGAFALIVCAIAAFAVAAEDSSDALPGKNIGDLAEAINDYSEDVLGTDKVVKATAADDGLKITVDTSSEAIEAVGLNLYGLYTTFTEDFEGFTTVCTKDANSAEIEIISNGAPTDKFDTFLARIVTGLKAALADESDYVGEIKVDGGAYTALKVSFTLSNEFKEVAEALSSVSGTPDAISINYHITDGVFEAFGISVDKIGDTTVSGVFDAFAKGKGPSAFLSSSAARYFNTICDKINTAQYLAGFLVNNIKVYIGDAVRNIDAVEVSDVYGFKGLMATLASATAGFGKVSENAIINGGTVDVQPISVKFKKGIQGDEFDSIGISMDIVYSANKITVNVDAAASEGGTVTLNNNLTSISGYSGTAFTVTATPDSGKVVSTVEYWIGNAIVDVIGTDVSSTTYIHFGEAAVHTIKVTFVDDSIAPPTPPAPAPDNPDEPEDLPDDGVVVNPDGSTTVTTTDPDTGTKSSVTEKDGKVTEVVSETISGDKYKSVGEGSNVTTTVWSDELNEFMVDALADQAAQITGGRTADLVIVSDEVNISAGVADDIADAFDTVVLTNADAHMEIPSSVIKNLGKDDKLKITSKQAASTDMNDKQRSVVGNNYVLSLSATVGTTAVHALGDSVTISFNYTPTTSMNGKHIVVKYVDEDGKTTEMPTTYTNGRASFVTDHFSIYFVEVVDDTPGGGSGGSSGNNLVLYCAVAAAAVAVIAVCVAVMYFKRD